MKQLLHEYAAVLAVRRARLVLGATVLSMVGDVMAMVALMLQLHDSGHGPCAVMALLICFAVPIVVTMGTIELVSTFFENQTAPANQKGGLLLKIDLDTKRISILCAH